MERPYTDLGWLREWTQIKAKVLEPGFELREIVPTATTMYDPQQGWLEDDGAMVITDIGGQGEPGWNPEKGHGAILKVHPDNRIEPIVPYGNSGRAMIMSSMRSSSNFGEYSNRPFPLGQLRPGRKGAHNTHAVFWVPPGANWVEHYVVVPDSGSINGGKSGALVSQGWASRGPLRTAICSSSRCSIARSTRSPRLGRSGPTSSAMRRTRAPSSCRVGSTARRRAGDSTLAS
jgi:hypothetical protein